MSPEEIKELRARANLSQADLAELLEVSPAAVGQWETGKTRPSRMKQEMLKVLDDELEERGGSSLKTYVARATGAVGFALLMRWLKEE